MGVAEGVFPLLPYSHCVAAADGSVVADQMKQVNGTLSRVSIRVGFCFRCMLHQETKICYFSNEESYIHCGITIFMTYVSIWNFKKTTNP